MSRAISSTLVASLMLWVGGCGSLLGPAIPQSVGVRVAAWADSAATYPPAKGFVPLADTAGAIRIARLDGYAPGQLNSRNGLDAAYAYFRDYANGIGANAYQVRERCAAANPCRFSADVYVVADSSRSAEDRLPADTVVLIGSLLSGESAFELNGDKRIVPPLHYLAYSNTGSDLSLSKAGVLPTGSVTLHAGRGEPPSYWSLTELAVEPTIVPAGEPGLGIAIGSRQLHVVEEGLGRFLVDVLHEVRTSTEG